MASARPFLRIVDAILLISLDNLLLNLFHRIIILFIIGRRLWGIIPIPLNTHSDGEILVGVSYSGSQYVGTGGTHAVSARHHTHAPGSGIHAVTKWTIAI